VADTTTMAFVLAGLSAFFNGSFPAVSRLPSGPALDPVLFNGLVAVGVFLTSLMVPLFTGGAFLFAPAGAAGGAVFVIAALFSFIAIPRVGLATAQAVWSCSAILTSFTWGAFGPGEIALPVGDITRTIAALVVLLIGVLIIVNKEKIALKFDGEEPDKPKKEKKVDPADATAGLVSAMTCGFFGGSILVPFKYLPPDVQGLAAVPSFGCGALVMGTLLTLGYWTVVKKEKGLPSSSFEWTLAGIVGGAIWSAGNCCSIIAQSPPYSLPYGIASPIRECALFFGGLWGIFVFSEIEGTAIGVFWAGAFILGSGIVALGLFGPGT